MKHQLRNLLVLCVLITACSSNAPKAPPLIINPLATEPKMPTATAAPSLVPTPISLTSAGTPVLVQTEAQTFSVCKSANYCPPTDCHKNECLFVSPSVPDYPVGIATVRGYYTQAERTAFSDTKLCDSLVIVGGSQVLINSYLSLIEAGNSVNSKNELNQPIISLDLNGVEARDKQRILASSADQPVEMLLLSPIPPGRSAPACYSPVEIVKVN
jgi:hypothetical protein